MAYVSQEHKAKIAPVIKALLKEYGLKGSLSVKHHSTIVLTITAGPIDFIGVGNRIAKATAERRGQDYYGSDRDYSQVNVYWIADHYDGVAREFLAKAYAALKGPDFFDHSDIQTDYFHRSHYQDINIGRWNKPYVLTQAQPKAAKKPARATSRAKTVTVKAVKSSGTRFTTLNEVAGYRPQDNTAPDESFSYVPTLEQLKRSIGA